MNDEKMKILKMLEDGKISAEDAAKLLSSSGDHRTYSSSEVKSAPARRDYGSQSNNSGSSPSSGSHRGGSFDGFAEDLGRKFDNFMRDIEPKLKNFSEKVVEKSAAMADSISKSVSSQSTRMPGKSYTPSTPEGAERSYELNVASGGCELNLSSINGRILLKGYNGDKITAKVYAKHKRSGGNLDFMMLGNKFILNYDEDYFDKVAVDAYIPYNSFVSINLSATNSAVLMTGVDCDNVSISNTNAELELSSLSGKLLKIDSQNGRELKLSNIKVSSAEIESSNGAIYANECDIENFRINGFNAPVTLNLSKFERYLSYVWIIETSNQKMNIFLPTSSMVGYYIKAAASLGSIKIGLTGLNYIFSDSYNSEAKSINYDKAEKKVRISLETSNAPLIIN